MRETPRTVGRRFRVGKLPFDFRAELPKPGFSDPLDGREPDARIRIAQGDGQDRFRPVTAIASARR